MLNYTESQQKAIETIDRNLQIIACAGSGKTQVISQRIVTILKTDPDVTPANIIAFTYTEKAAAELKTRILSLCRDQLGVVRGLAEMYIGTIHGWCLNILQDHIYEFQKFSVLDEIKLKLFVDRYYKEIGMLDLNMDKFKETGYFVALMGILREAELAPGKAYPPEFISALHKYETTLKQYCYFDFTMIMTETVNHLRNDMVFWEKLRASLKYLIVDEYQDVNPVQEQIVEQLAKTGANICVVGDDDQTIYQWRGGDVKYIQQFREKYPNVEYIKLEDNFRSTPGVVQTALTTIRHNQQRLPKVMNAAGHQQYERGDILYNQYNSVVDENQFMIEAIRNLSGTVFHDKKTSEARGLDFADFVVLIRTWKKAKPIMEAFAEANIPFIVAGVNELFRRPEAQAAKAIFEFLKGEIEAEVLKAYWQEVPERLALSAKLDPAALDQAIEFLQTNHDPYSKSYYGAFSLQQAFWDFLGEAQISEETFHNPAQSPIVGTTTEEVIFYNLGMFSQVIQDFELIHFRSKPSRRITDFLNFLKYAAEGYYPEGWLNNTYKTPNAVQIMTIFQAKGLEFPVVFIPGLNRNYLPIKGHSGKSIWKHYIKDPTLIKDQQRYEGGDEDERRLLYVAITRSKKFLFFTRAPEISENTGQINDLYKVESKFCKEFSHSDYVFSSKRRDFSERPKTKPRPQEETQTILLNFSVLKSYFDCPYRFKLISLYGFMQPITMPLGYGRSVHNLLMEIHRKSLEGVDTVAADLPELLDRHMHLPYETEERKLVSREKIEKLTTKYLDLNRDDFPNIVFAEKDIQLDLGEGIMVNGRMDLIKKKNLDGTMTTTIVDFKSKEDVQTRDLTWEQLSLYALGYRELTGEQADFLQIYNLDQELPHPDTQELFYDDLETTQQKIVQSANQIRANNLNKTCDRSVCNSCYYIGLCSGI